MTRLTIATTILTLGVGLGGARFTNVPVEASAAQTGAPTAQQHHPAGELQQEPMQMMHMMQQTMAEMKAMDDRLEGLVETMKSTTGAAKVDAIAEVVATLIEQRTAMRDRMMGMQCHMMSQMMQHMSPDMPAGMMGTANCPQMPAMGGGSLLERRE